MTPEMQEKYKGGGAFDHAADELDRYRKALTEYSNDYHALYRENEQLRSAIHNARLKLEPLAKQINPSLLVIRELLYELNRIDCR